jgi:hypothetical protein
MRRVPLMLLVALGLLQMAGDLLGLPILKAIGAASGASPAPRVFTTVRGLETFSTRFWLEWEATDGSPRSLAVTPEVYRRLRGPYNWRNVYGAALAFGPVLATGARTRPMFQAVAAYALCGDAPLLRELGIDPNAVRGRPRIWLAPRPGTDPVGLPRVLEAPCG